jgi:uncharacterized membrane protein
MADIPSIWREGLWHSFLVHLPIVTLLLASIAALLKPLFSKDGHRLFLGQTTFVMLVIGVLSGWIAIYTGELAYDIEVRKICDPKVLQEHQWWGYASLITYSIALALITGLRFMPKKFLSLARPFLLLLLAAGLIGLCYTGHLGASLVYQQGAGTYKPSPDCSEFVK